ncbi:EVE domain-containing protein, partial [Pseudomonas sp. MWU13-2860]
MASRDPVRRCLAGCFAQLCHGKAAPLRRMAAGDGLIYYSPVLSLEGREPCQRFTAVCLVADSRVYPFRVSVDFEPYRHDIAFWPAEDPAIRPLLGQLSFIAVPVRWGYALRCC